MANERRQVWLSGVFSTAVVAFLALGAGAISSGEVAAGQIIAARLSPCNGETIVAATSRVFAVESGAPVEPIESTFRPTKGGGGIVSLALRAGYYDVAVSTDTCEGGTRFAVLPGHDRAASIKLHEYPRPHQVAPILLWGPTLGVAGTLPRGIVKGTLYSATQGSSGKPIPVYIDRAAYYADRIGPGRYILVLRTREGRFSQIALDVSDSAYTLQRRDISNVEVLTAQNVLGSPFHRPEKIVRGHDGNMWYLDRAGNSVGRVSQAGDTTVFRLPSFASAPADIAAGSDSVWVTETVADSIARVSYRGIVSEYRLPPRADPRGHGRSLERIVAGADGRMWFSERAQPYLGAIDGRGTITEYPLGTGETGATCLVTGGDGLLWFGGFNLLGAMDTKGRVKTSIAQASWVVSMAGSREGAWADDGEILHITTHGISLRRAIPLRGSSPLVMTEITDGVLSFVDQHGETEGSVDPQGVVTQKYIDSFWPAGVRDIVADENGRLWVAESKQNTIYNGENMYFPPHRSDPTFLAIGPSGDVWFTSPSGGDVGVVRHGNILCFSVDPGRRHYGCDSSRVRFVGSTSLP